VEAAAAVEIAAIADDSTAEAEDAVSAGADRLYAPLTSLIRGPAPRVRAFSNRSRSGSRSGSGPEGWGKRFRVQGQRVGARG